MKIRLDDQIDQQLADIAGTVRDEKLGVEVVTLFFVR